MFIVGSIVRAKRGSKSCRAMIATVGGSVGVVDPNDAVDDLCILWEPIYPNAISEKFLITPKSIHKETEQDEAIVKVDTVKGLLPFEIAPHNDNDVSGPATGSDKEASNITMWKERGDQLLRMGDSSAATSYYEKALFDSSSVSIGGTVIISVEGFPRIAEVDCVNDDDGGTIDVTLVHNDDEKTIKQLAVLLSIMETDATNLQERILLNLARCMIQLSELDVSNRPKYLKSAVLATTLVITISYFRDQQQSANDESLLLPTNALTALVLRCKSYTGLSKWSKAMADARKISNCGSSKERGRKLLIDIERKKKLRSKTDKKLAKQICLLVQSATASIEPKKKSDSEDSSKTLVSRKISSSRDITRQRMNATLPFNADDNKRNTDSVEVSGRNATNCLEHQEAFTNSRPLSIPRVNLGLASAYFFVALVAILVTFLIAKGNNYSIFLNIDQILYWNWVQITQRFRTRLQEMYSLAFENKEFK